MSNTTDNNHSYLTSLENRLTHIRADKVNVTNEGRDIAAEIERLKLAYTKLNTEYVQLEAKEELLLSLIAETDLVFTDAGILQTPQTQNASF